MKSIRLPRPQPVLVVHKSKVSHSQRYLIVRLTHRDRWDGRVGVRVLYEPSTRGKHQRAATLLGSDGEPPMSWGRDQETHRHVGKLACEYLMIAQSGEGRNERSVGVVGLKVDVQWKKG